MLLNEYFSGLKASDEVCKLFPNDANLLFARASLLRLMNGTNLPDYRNWARQKKQIEIVKEAYKNYLKVAPKDHRQFAESNYVLAYLSLKYSTPSSQMSLSEIQEISFHFQNSLNAEVDVLPCFLHFHSRFKEFVTKNINIEHVKYVNTLNVDLTKHGMPGRPKPRTISTENETFIDIRKPTERFEIC